MACLSAPTGLGPSGARAPGTSAWRSSPPAASAPRKLQSFFEQRQRCGGPGEPFRLQVPSRALQVLFQVVAEVRHLEVEGDLNEAAGMRPEPLGRHNQWHRRWCAHGFPEVLQEPEVLRFRRNGAESLAKPPFWSSSRTPEAFPEAPHPLDSCRRSVGSPRASLARSSLAP